MAHHKSAKKRIRQTARRTGVNTMRVSKIRRFIRGVEEAIVGGDQTQAKEALRVAQPFLHAGVTKGVLQKNAVARKLSRLSARIKAMNA